MRLDNPKQVREFFAAVLAERRADAIEQWIASDTPETREIVHAAITAIEDLRDRINGRIDQQLRDER